MRARDVVGRRIVAIEQQQVQRGFLRGRPVFHLDAIVLDDGTRIRLEGVERDDGGPLVEARVVRR